MYWSLEKDLLTDTIQRNLVDLVIDLEDDLEVGFDQDEDDLIASLIEDDEIRHLTPNITTDLDLTLAHLMVDPNLIVARRCKIKMVCFNLIS